MSADDVKAWATRAVNDGVKHLHALHGVVDPNVALAVVVCGMGLIGVMKALGKMPHAASKMIGRGEFMGAMFIVLPRAVMQGFGRVAGCCIIFAVMGAMMAIKPKALVTEALFIAMTSKIMALEWAIVPHKEITGMVQWEAVMAFFIAHGVILGLGIRAFAAVTSDVGKVGGAKKADKKRTKRA